MAHRPATSRLIASVGAACVLAVLLSCSGDEAAPAAPPTDTTPTNDSAPADTSGDAEAPSNGSAEGNGAGSEEEADVERVPVTLGGKAFRMELALTDEARRKGLSRRDTLAEDGGMLFVFPYPQRQYFHMPYCRFPIDIAYLDDSGRIVKMYTMEVEPRREGESDAAYRDRLTRYPSRYRVRYVVEVMGGTFDELGVEKGDTVEFDREALKRRAR